MSNAGNERKVDSGTVLRVYQILVEQGERVGEESRLGVLAASAGFDGYSVMVTDGVVTARPLFHNKLQIDTPSGRALEVFNQRLAQVLEGRTPT